MNNNNIYEGDLSPITLRCIYPTYLMLQADSGSSVDPVEKMEIQQSGSGQDLTPAQPSNDNKGSKDGGDNSKSSKAQTAPPPKR